MPRARHSHESFMQRVKVIEKIRDREENSRKGRKNGTEENREREREREVDEGEKK